MKLEADAELMFRQQYGKEKDAKGKKLWEHIDNMMRKDRKKRKDEWRARNGIEEQEQSKSMIRAR